MLKKIVVVMLVLLSASGLMASGGSSILGGGTGILTIPTANTMGKGVLDLGFYFITPETLAFSVGFGFIERLDLSFGLELDNDSWDADPYVHIRAKYRFAGDGKSDSWAFGADLALALGDAVSDDNEISIYLVNSSYMSSLGMEFTWGIGYTFGYDDNINLMVGVSKKIIENLYLEMDFANFSNRYFWSHHGDANRGVGNLGLRVHLFDGKLRLTAGLFDAFDASREFGLGATFKLTL